MKKTFFFFSVGLCIFFAGFSIANLIKKPTSNENLAKIIPIAKPLESYTIDNLSNGINSGEFTKGKVLSQEKNYTSYLFDFRFSPNLKSEQSKTTTGMINIPEGQGPFPLVLLLRGYVDQKSYQTGAGSKNVGYYLAENGFITLAPDFLGYAGSDSESDNIFESRFQTYVTAVSLLNSIGQIENWDGKNIFIWGHSNGGQIALTVLEISQRNIPTVLWAPVSKPFPYSILYYTDESDDHGRLIRSELAKFEQIYDVEKYSLTNYFGNIDKNIKIQIHQGTSDQSVPRDWTDTLVKNLDNQDVQVEYFLYPGADHNLRPSWNTAVERTLVFFRRELI